MRSLVAVAVLLMVFAFQATAQNKATKEWNISLIESVPSGGMAHDSANRFANKVGDKLKQAYPARVVSVNVQVDPFIMKDGKTIAHFFNWEAKIVSCAASEADWYFDRRGTYLSGPTKSAALQAVEKNVGKEKKKDAVIKAVGAKKKSLYVKRTAGNKKTGYWALVEIFAVGPKP